MTFTNRLIHEKSPYLLQHAHNPVDWYPWGEEAFEAAQKQQKPVFLSIGYATCHWCHVMESESFGNQNLAKLMNETFINIKVDREELPHVDSVYMEFAQALMSSAGGWPLNLVLTPDLKPIFAVTYLPPKTRRGMMGLDEFIQQIDILWNSEERQKLVDQADKVIELFQKISSHTTGTDLPDEELLARQIEVLFELADPVNGGIKGEPKFPLGYQVVFFLAFARLQNDSRALFYSELTLDKMARGGIYDQLGGGFSRYSVDKSWLVPHFEKMLYDNVILARAYLDAWLFTKKTSYRMICEEILQYLLREMSNPDGGFYSAEDADIEGHEGIFYTWTLEEIEEVLGKEEALLFSHVYGVTNQGNFEAGRSILHLEIPLESLDEKLQERLKKSRALLFEKRNTRPRPFKDDKILTGWNGLAIDVFARAGLAFKNIEYTQMAEKTATFIHQALWKEGRLLRRYREGESRFSAGLEDYAYLIHGILSLFESQGGEKWLQWAQEMAHVLEKEFKIKGGAFYQSDASIQVLVRKCEYYDGAEPSGNGVHAENLLRLFQLTKNETFFIQAEDIFKAAKSHMTAYPQGACYHLLALLRYLDKKATTVVIALNNSEEGKEKIKETLGQEYAPHRAVMWQGEEGSLFYPDQIPVEGQTTVYICRQDACESPLTAQEEIITRLQSYA